MERGKDSSSYLEKVEVQRIPWLIVIITTVLTSFVFTFVSAVIPVRLAEFFNLAWMYTDRTGWNAGPYLILFLMTLLTQVFPRLRAKLSPALLTYIFAATMISLAYANSYYPWRTLQLWWKARALPDYEKLLPSFWGPSLGVYRDFIAAKADFMALVPAIGFWSIFMIAWYFFFASLTSIVRRLWMDTEMLAFPYNQLVIMSMNEIVGVREASSSMAKRRVFYVAALIGFIAYLPVQLNILLPWLPDLYGWNTRPEFVSVGTWTAGGVDLTMVFPGLSTQIVGIMGFYTNPAVAALLYLVPMKTLFSVWFGYLLFMVVLPQIAYTMGEYQGILQGGNFAKEAMLMRNWPLKLLAFGSVGMLSGIIVWNVVLNRKFYMSTLRMAFGKASDKERDLEMNEPVSYRTSYLMFIASAVLILILLISSGTSLIPAIIVLFSALIIDMGAARMHGLAGPQPSSWNHGHFFMLFLWPVASVTGAVPPNQDYWLSMLLARCQVAGGAACYGFYPSALFTLDGLKVAQVERSSVRNTFITMALAGIIAPIIATASAVWLVNRFGGGLPGWNLSASFATAGAPSGVAIALGPEPNWIPALVGFLVAGGLSYMSYMYPWWPLEPVGLALSVSFGFTRMGMWSMYLVAWIVKYLTFKIGGTRFDEQYGIPLVAGFLAGNLSSWLFGMVASVIRFFFPW